MSEHDHSHDSHGHEAHASAPDFAAAEWQEFRDDDVQSGTVVICLMSAIFTIGLLLYTTIAVTVW